MTASIHHNFNLVCYWGVDRMNTGWRGDPVLHTHLCTAHTLMSLMEKYTSHLVFVTSTARAKNSEHTYTARRTFSLRPQGRCVLHVWSFWPLPSGSSPEMYHPSFKAIKHFSMRIALSSLSKMKRRHSQSHFLPNPIKGGKRRGENEVEDLKWRAFI